MAELTNEEVVQKVLHYLETAGRVKARAVSKAINIDKHLVDAVIRQLATDDKIEFFYLDTTYIRLKGK